MVAAGGEDGMTATAIANENIGVEDAPRRAGNRIAYWLIAPAIIWMTLFRSPEAGAEIARRLDDIGIDAGKREGDRPHHEDAIDLRHADHQIGRAHV